MKYFLIIVVLFLVSCSGSKTVTKKDNDANSKYDESFDPLTLDDNDIEFPSLMHNVDTKNISTANNNDKIPDLQQEVNGFRVQIIATQDLEKATLLEEEAKSQFSIYGHKTYLVFEAPLYKIRIGDFTNRNEADELKIQALKYRYREAFIVRTKVMLNANDGMQDM